MDLFANQMVMPILSFKASMVRVRKPTTTKRLLTKSNWDQTRSTLLFRGNSIKEQLSRNYYLIFAHIFNHAFNRATPPEISRDHSRKKSEVQSKNSGCTLNLFRMYTGRTGDIHDIKPRNSHLTFNYFRNFFSEKFSSKKYFLSSTNITV